MQLPSRRGLRCRRRSCGRGRHDGDRPAQNKPVGDDRLRCRVGRAPPRPGREVRTGEAGGRSGSDVQYGPRAMGALSVVTTSIVLLDCRCAASRPRRWLRAGTLRRGRRRAVSERPQRPRRSGSTAAASSAVCRAAPRGRRSRHLSTRGSDRASHAPLYDDADAVIPIRRVVNGHVAQPGAHVAQRLERLRHGRHGAATARRRVHHRGAAARAGPPRCGAGRRLRLSARARCDHRLALAWAPPDGEAQARDASDRAGVAVQHVRCRDDDDRVATAASGRSPPRRRP